MLFSPEMMVKITNGVIYTNAYVCDYSFNAVIFTDDAFLKKTTEYDTTEHSSCVILLD